jgi:hypothetical protein
MSAIRPLPLVGILLVAISLSLAGCDGDGTVPVTGTVTLDGAPLEGAAVLLEPSQGGTPASATTDTSGSFSLNTVPGPYKVGISKTNVTMGEGAEVHEDAGGEVDDVDTEYVTPLNYASPMTSGLTVDVAAGMDPVTFDLTSEGGGAGGEE